MGNIIYSPLSQTLVLSEWIRWGPLFRILGLGEAEFKSLFGFFKSLELSKHPGLISIGDLSRRLKFKSNILICSSFMIFDENWNGFCNFAEFTICLWNFCTHTPSALLFYSYQKVSGEDSDSSSIITVDDALSALKTLHWENDVQCSDWPQVLQYVATRMNGDLSPLEFDQMFPFSCPIMKPIQRVRNAIFTSVVPESSFVHADTKTYVFRGDSLSLAQLKRKGIAPLLDLKHEVTTNHKTAAEGGGVENEMETIINSLSGQSSSHQKISTKASSSSRSREVESIREFEELGCTGAFEFEEA